MLNITSTSHLVQLIAALGGGISYFVISYMGFQRPLFYILIVFIPFQLIDSKYGTLNMALTYLLGASMFINRTWIKKQYKKNWPLMTAFLIILFSFFISWTQAPKIFYVKTFFYLIMLGSNVVLFYMTYHMISNGDDINTIIIMLLISNILVIVYCIIQMNLGVGRFNLLGIREFAMAGYRADRRIVGTFNAVGITAEYLIIQCLLLGYFILFVGRYKQIVFYVILFNIALLIGTGNRGGFISFIFGAILFFHTFKKQIGLKKIILSIITLLIVICSTSFVMIKYTQFDRLFERLLETQVEGIVPDSRGGIWELTVEKIFEKPILGHGPRLVVLADFKDSLIKWPKGEINFYPHSLYLYILYTVGIFGLMAYSVLAFTYIYYLLRAKQYFTGKDEFYTGLAKLGIIIVIIVSFDQFKVELLRFDLLDYQHYLAVLFGMFCGLRRLADIRMFENWR